MMRSSGTWLVGFAIVCCFVTTPLAAYTPQPESQSESQPESQTGQSHHSNVDRSGSWPSWSTWRRVFLLQDYNTRVVVWGTTLLGCACGMVGSFTLLRKRALMGDALSHATLPGIAIAFIVATSLGYDGKSLPVLLAGATISGVIGVILILMMGRLTRLKEDTALGAVLSVFFGAGVALLGLVQQLEGGHAAGLDSFIYGKTASMGMVDSQLIAVAAAICVVVTLLLFKELKLLCFDDDFAQSRGVSVVLLDVILMGLVIVVTIVGLQAVGLILMIALLIIPAAAARFWTESLSKMFVISGLLGAVGGWAGAATSAVFSKLPSGAMIVLVCTSMFLLSMIFGSSRGVLTRLRKKLQLNRNVKRQHLLRAFYELTDRGDSDFSSIGVTITIDDLLKKRTWTRSQLRSAIRQAQNDELIEHVGDQLQLSRRGMIEAKRLTRQHRLWELYLITHADVAPSRVDRDADAIEHVLEPEIVAELELLLAEEQTRIPDSPHDLTGSPSDSPLGVSTNRADRGER